MADVQFKDPYTYERRGKGGGMAGWVMRKRMARTPIGANAVLVIFAVVMFGISALVLFMSTPHVVANPGAPEPLVDPADTTMAH